MSSPKPLFSFGIISDIQYADVPDGHNFSRTKTRYYRNGISVIEAAGRIWANHSPPVDFIVDLGDLVDGKAKLVCSESALNAVLAAFNALHKPVYHTWGNHEFYNFSRTALMQSEIFSGNMPQASGPKGKAYYTIQPHPKLLIVSLDGYETSVLGYDKSEMPYQQAMKILAAHNPNQDKNSPDGISGEERRYMAYNGGLGAEQVNWLKDTLTRAQQNGVNVVIISHIPALASTAGWSEVLWNYDEVLTLLGQYRDCVACFIAGHYHETGFDVDDNGIPHMTMPGVIESPPGQTDCCTVDVYTDQLDFQGQGTAHSCQIPLAFPLS